MTTHNPPAGEEKLRNRLDHVKPVIEESRKAFGTPSLVCGVLHEGKTVFTYGTGLADVEKNLAANEDTVYPIASCTKSFTTAACGILVDEGLLSWTESVKTYLPEFQTVHDPEISKRATLLDLCSHGTGLAPIDHLVCGFHDEFWVSESQQIQTASNLPVCYNFKFRWLYNNTILGVVGEIVARVAGQSSGTFIQERIFKPLGMTRSCTKTADHPSDGNSARGYSVLDDGSLLPLRPSALEDGNPQGGAGYVRSTVRDMLTWACAVMEAETDDFERLSRMDLHQENNGGCNPLRQIELTRCGHRPITHQGSGYGNSYGLGWFRHMLPSSWLASIGPNYALLPDPPVINRDGPPRLTIAHWGEFNGFLTAFYTFPATRSAVVVMVNSSPGRGDPADLVAQMLTQELFDMEPRVNFESYALHVPNTKHGQIDAYVGSYTNGAYGLTINVHKLSPEDMGPESHPELLEFNVNSISRQSARLRHYHHDTWTFLPDSRDDALKKGMEAFLHLPMLLLVFVRDESGAISAVEWDLQAGVCEGPAPGISTIVAPIRFQRDVDNN